jgi:hypothetical protein
MIMGSSNAIPKPRKNCSTNDIKSLILRNVATPIASPHLYRKLSANGITAMYEKATPAKNKEIVGRNTFIFPARFVCLLNAGEIKPYISLITIGIEAMIPTNVATYSCAKKACPGAVWISFTPSGRSVACINEVIWMEKL